MGVGKRREMATLSTLFLIVLYMIRILYKECICLMKEKFGPNLFMLFYMYFIMYMFYEYLSRKRLLHFWYQSRDFGI